MASRSIYNAPNTSRFLPQPLSKYTSQLVIFKDITVLQCSFGLFISELLDADSILAWMPHDSISVVDRVRCITLAYEVEDRLGVQRDLRLLGAPVPVGVLWVPIRT